MIILGRPGGVRVSGRYHSVCYSDRLSHTAIYYVISGGDWAEANVQVVSGAAAGSGVDCCASFYEPRPGTDALVKE